ncbi:hypothetical protein LTR94_034764, partial [Friedmanniomyces endolithicus]
LRLRHQVQRQICRRLRREAGVGRQRPCHCRGGEGAGRADCQDAAVRRQAGLSLRHDAVRAPVGGTGDPHAGRGGGAGLPRHVPVPAELAGDDHPDHRGAGGAARHLCGDGGGGLHHQHADA